MSTPQLTIDELAAEPRLAVHLDAPGIGAFRRVIDLADGVRL